jgi:hypothetical protein
MLSYNRLPLVRGRVLIFLLSGFVASPLDASLPLGAAELYRWKGIQNRICHCDDLHTYPLLAYTIALQFVSHAGPLCLLQYSLRKSLKV